MEPNGRCLLTGAPAEIVERPGGRDVTIYKSKPCGTYEVSRTLVSSKSLWRKYADRLHLIAGLARRYSDSGRKLTLHTGHLGNEETIQSLIAGVRPPSDPLEQIDDFLLYVYDRANRAASYVTIDEKTAYPMQLLHFALVFFFGEGHGYLHRYWIPPRNRVPGVVNPSSKYSSLSRFSPLT